METGEKVELDRLVTYARRLPRSGPLLDRAWTELHASSRPVMRRAVDTGERAAESALRRLPRWAPPSPASMVEREVEVDGIPVFYRVSARPAEGPPMIHVHGFGISGTYLLPTAGRLADEFATYVPDLPGYGRSGSPARVLGIPALADALARFMDAVGIERASLVGNSLGTAVSIEFAARYPERTDRLVLVSPAGGLHNRPLIRGLAQILRDVPREPLRLVSVALPDYLRFGLMDCLRLFIAMTKYPALDRMIALEATALAVLGGRDPLLPRARRVREVVTSMAQHVTLIRLPDVAHAANFSHPEVVAHAIRCFMRGDPITPLPGHPGEIQIANAALYRRTADPAENEA
jgi:pimeloyl-ACP methyl ester carboxylesterase